MAARTVKNNVLGRGISALISEQAPIDEPLTSEGAAADPDAPRREPRDGGGGRVQIEARYLGGNLRGHIAAAGPSGGRAAMTDRRRSLTGALLVALGAISWSFGGVLGKWLP